MTLNDEITAMFSRRVSDANEWFQHARALFAAAKATIARGEALFNHAEKSDLDNVASMLYALAIENLFKAVYVLNKFGPSHDPRWNPEALFPPEIKTHDLIALATLIDPELPNEFGFTLSMLTDSSTWAGRYPCSIKGTEGSHVRFPSKIHPEAEVIFARYARFFSIDFS